MSYYQLLSGYTGYDIKSWSEKIKGVGNFDELLNISVKLNKEIEFLPIKVIGDLQLKLKRRVRQIKTRLNDNLEYAEII
jgi:hypothetical protein